MYILLKMKLDLLCLVLCSLENKWEQRRTHTQDIHTHTQWRLYANNVVPGNIWLGAPIYHVTAYRLLFPQSRAWDKGLHASCLSGGVISRGRSGKQEERRRKSQHKDELLSWPLLYETGYWVLWDHVWCPCCPLGEHCSISSYCPLVKSWPIHMHESQAIPKEPCAAAVEKWGT